MFKEFHYQVRGRGHVLDGRHGQDRSKFLSRGGVQALCLADGAGSAKQSGFGAQALVEEGCALFVDSFAQFIASDDGAWVKMNIVQRLLGRLHVVAGRRGCDMKDLAATFLIVAASGDRFVVAHVGDGVIGYLKNGELRVVSRPDNGEFANQTSFVTSERAAAEMRLFRGSLEGVSGFVLMSDGTSSSLYDQRTGQLAPACARMVGLVGAAPSRTVKNPEHKKQLRKLVDTRIRNATKDDCSIGILGRANPTAAPSELPVRGV